MSQAKGLSMDFSLRIGNKVILDNIKEDSNKNYVFSPLSLHILLSLIAPRTSGKCLEQILSLLGAESLDEIQGFSSKMMDLLLSTKERPTLLFVNCVWFDQGYDLKPAFEEIAKGLYRSHVQMVNFKENGDEVRNVVNSWAEKATKGLIKDLLPPKAITKQTVAVLANALYFKANWDREYFKASDTVERDFHLLNGRHVKVPFMKRNNHVVFSRFNSFDSHKVLSLPYKCRAGTDWSIYFFLPHQKDGLPQLIQEINSQPGFYSRNFGFGTTDFLVSSVWIPKFKFSFNFEASEVMKELGLALPFQAGGLSEMFEVDSCKSDDFAVSQIYHKAYIQVNEEGTEAAAAGAESDEDMGCGLWDCKIDNFVADHPFLFMIRECGSRTVLFAGAVLNPLEGA